jgi:hypothetical protein
MRIDHLGGVTIGALSVSRLLATDANDKLVSVSDLSAWIGGTTNRVTVASDGDGTVTLSAPQDIHSAATPTFAGLIAPWLRPASDSTTALQLRNAAGSAVVTVDTTNGRLGVGITPTAKLHVRGIPGSASHLKIDTTTTASADKFIELVSGGNISSGSHWIYATDGLADGSDFIVRGDGAVAIGSLDPGSYKLHVTGTGKFTGAVDTDVQFLGQAADTVSAPSFSWTTDTNTGMWRPSADTIAFSTGGAERVRIASTGAMSVSNPSSGATLNLGRISGQPTIKATEAYLIMDSLSNFAAINHFVNQNVILAYGGGNVGIGTNAPTSYKLDVSGDIRATGDLYVDGGRVDFGTNYFDEVTDFELRGTKALSLFQTIKAASWNITTAGVGTLTDVISPSVRATTGMALTLGAGTDIILSPTSLMVKSAANVSLQSSAYASQTTGWRITDAGEADFRYLFVDEMHAKSFIADLEQALAGGQIIAKSVAMVATDFALPAAGAAGTLRVKDLPSAPNMAVFQSGDFVGLRQFSRSAGSLTIGWAWGTVTAYADGTGGNEGTQTWTFTRSATPGSASGTIPADALVLDFGVSGNGFYEVNATDGAYGQNSPYAQVVTWAVHPATQTVRTRMGNLRGIFSVADEFGLYAGSGTAVTDRYIRASSAALELRNVPLALFDGTNNTLLLSAGTNNNSPFLAMGSPLPTGPLVNNGIWAGKNGNDYELRVGTISGGVLVKGLHWDGANLVWKATNTSLDESGNLTATNATLSGQITATTGAIGGWTIAASGLTATNIGLYSGAANTARVQVGSGSDVAGLNATAAAGDIAFWAGDTHANRAVAEFRVTAAGALTATSGTVGGWTLGASSLTGGSATLSNAGKLTLGTSNDVLIADAADATYRLYIGHATAASAPFWVTKAGSMKATLGTIGGWTLSASSLTSGSAGTTVGLDTGGTNPAIYAGSATPGSAPFRVTNAGVLTATSGTVGGWTLGASSLTGGNAVLSNTGILTLGTSNNVAVMSAADADYRLWVGHASAASAPFAVSKGGVLVSTSGLIGGWAITSNRIQGGPDAKLYATGKMELGTILGMVVIDPNHADWRIWIGSAADIATNPLAGQFRVSDDGYLTASGATIYGHLVANSGDFAGAVTIGTGGGIYQGTGTFASPTTGLKIWNDSGVGRIGGYNAGALQWYAGTDGKLYAGGGAVTLDADGLNITAGSALRFISTSLRGVMEAGNPVESLISNYPGITVKSNGSAVAETVNLLAKASSNRRAEVSADASSNSTISLYAYTGSAATASLLQLSASSFSLAVGSSATTLSVPENGTVQVTGNLLLDELASTPAAPGDGYQARMYVKSDKLVIQYKDGINTRYKYLDLTGTGVTWVHTLTAP